MMYCTKEALYKFTIEEFDALTKRAHKAGRGTKEQILFENIKPHTVIENSDLTDSRR